MRVALLRAACRSAGRRCLSSAPLAALRAAELAHSTAKLDLEIADADAGGHALLGRNGSGKSIIGRALCGDAHIKSGALDRPARTAHVSFEAHEALAKEDVTVYEALGKLQTKASKYLAVRFGLHPLLWRPVKAVSTGEIRKVLLARALSARPDLVVLDNAFDGLDAPSRAALAKLLSQMSRGWGDILVRDMPSAKEAARTQLLQVTHRASEILPEVTRLTWMTDEGARTETCRVDADLEARLLAATSRKDVAPVADLMRDLGPPSHEDDLLVEARGLGVTTGDTTILRGVDWTVAPGEHWLVAGGNGAGKSTLAALLTRPAGDDGVRWGPAATRSIEGEVRTTRSVAWVSTELHLRAAASSRSARAMLALFGAEDAAPFAAGLGLRDLARPFRALSQGEQKLLLVAAAVAARPRLLVLDEVTQGLDAFQRGRVLALAEAYAARGTLVFVTHHTSEHLRCLTHVLHLVQNDAPVYCGARAAWDPLI